MKWRYINKEEEEEKDAPQYIINASPSSGGAVTKIIENTRIDNITKYFTCQVSICFIYTIINISSFCVGDNSSP